jgi:hypothetical protein
MGLGDMISICGPFKGCCADITIAKETLVPQMLFGERGMGDKVYNDEMFFLFPHRGEDQDLTREQKTFNFKVYSIRQAVERVIRRLKNFGCLKQKWRMSPSAHKVMTMVCAKLTNIQLAFEPLDSP